MSDRPYDLLLLDAGQTLLHPAEPVEETYARVARAHGVRRSPQRIRAAFRLAFEEARPADGGQRYRGDGRAFWREVVARSVGSPAPAIFEELFQHYAHAPAWRVADGAIPTLQRLRAAGIRVALVSDWDTRLRPLLGELHLLEHLDHLAISCEVGFEKPEPRLFLSALEALSVPPSRAVHVGDDLRRDALGARLAGIDSWIWGRDVQDFQAIEARLLGLSG